MFPEGIRVRVEEEGVDIFKTHSGCSEQNHSMWAQSEWLPCLTLRGSKPGRIAFDLGGDRRQRSRYCPQM